MKERKINIMSIFFSISGEINMWPQGMPVIFIRFAGCNCRCSYCDTPDSIDSKGTEMTVSQILSEVAKHPVNRVLITGGEPLLQPDGLALLINKLVNTGYEVSIETNGSFQLFCGFQPDCWVVDIKMPGSGQHKKMVSIRQHLECSKNIIFKIPVQTQMDLISAKKLLDEVEDIRDYLVAFSPVLPMTAPELWEYMNKYGLTWCVLNSQLHKMIGLE